MTKKSFNPLRSRKGFTIFEIITVIVLILVVIYPLARVVSSSLETSSEEQHLTHCALLAQLKVEEFRTRTNCYSNQTAVSDCPDPAVVGATPTQSFGKLFATPPPCNFPFPFNQYECSARNYFRTGTANRLKVVQVRVWYDKNNDDVFEADQSEPDVYLETQMAARPPHW